MLGYAINIAAGAMNVEDQCIPDSSGSFLLREITLQNLHFFGAMSEKWQKMESKTTLHLVSH